MIESGKRFWVCTKPDGKKDVVWNWKQNMHSEIYPEYERIDGPFNTRKEAEQRTGHLIENKPS